MGLIRRYGLSGVDIDWRLGADGSYLADLFEEFRGYMEPWGNAAKADDVGTLSLCIYLEASVAYV